MWHGERDMPSINRRHYLKLLGTLAGSLIGCNLQGRSVLFENGLPRQPRDQSNIQARSVAAFPTRKEYGGGNLSGWEVVLGDGVYTAPGVPAVNSGDIETVHFTGYSELRANIHVRRIMAHNITFKRIYDDAALNYSHTAKYKFQIPYQPSTKNSDLNGETVEGHLSIWDGITAKLEYLVAFQWIVNPWATNYGAIQAWHNPGVWKTVGQLAPDTAWHEVQMTLDTGKASTSLIIDGLQYPSFFSTLTHPDWGEEVAARLAAEIISLYPGELGNGALHKTDFKEWSWIWEPRNVHIPLVIRG